MTDFREGENRYQSTLFPGRLEDYVSEYNAVRVIEVIVDELDLSRLGFKAEPNDVLFNREIRLEPSLPEALRLPTEAEYQQSYM